MKNLLNIITNTITNIIIITNTIINNTITKNY